MKPTTLTLLLLLPLGLAAQFNFETRVTNALGATYTSFSNANVMAANGDIVHLVYSRGLWSVATIDQRCPPRTPSFIVFVNYISKYMFQKRVYT